MDIAREEIVNRIDTNKLSAQVAVEARYDDIYNLIMNIIASSEPGMENHVTCIRRDNIPIEVDIPSFKICASSAYNHYAGIFLEFSKKYIDCNDNDSPTVTIPKITCGNLSYDGAIEFGNSQHKMITVAKALSDKLDNIKELVNSPIFKQYEDDVKAVYDAKTELKKHDVNMREQRINEQMNAFYAGDVLIDDCSHHHTVLRVCGKRLYITNYTYRNGVPRRTIEKKFVAELIVDGRWRLQR